MAKDELILVSVDDHICEPADMSESHVPIAQHAAVDPQLVRVLTASYRAAAANHLTSDAAVLLERPGQMWSLRRAFLSRDGAQP
jgi:hypothetical protein